jgi:diguanylate cyclase (GGDEF)-like protein
MTEPSPPLSTSSTSAPALQRLHERLERMHGSGGFAWWPDAQGLLVTEACARRHGLAVDASASLAMLLHAYAPDARRLLREALEHAARDTDADLSLELALTDQDRNTAWIDWTLHGQVDARGARCVVAGFRERRSAGAGALSVSAHVDALTGVSNRRGLRAHAPLAVAAARHSGRSLALLFIDLDHFKQVNDRQGHHAGDELLREVAQRLRGCVRGSDLIARQGGDEFVVVLSDMQRMQDAGLVAQKIVDALTQPFHPTATPVTVGCSIGVALLSDACADFDALMRAADTAMYAAKHAGRNTFRFYSDAFSQRLQQRSEMEQQLRHALERDELFLLYQPAVRCDQERIGGIEALLRWRAPDGELRRPIDFLTVAEETGEIVSIGRWALREACRQARRWIDGGLEFDRITVNVSAAQLRQASFADDVLAACHDAGIDPTRLELELPEAAMLADRDATRRAFATLRPHGIAISVDDFGTGFSNLIALHRFQLSSLKLDRHFALGMQDDPALQDLTRAVIGIGHALRLRMVAKGIETQQAAEFLSDRGCDEVQGFHIARPMPAADVALWWNARALAPRALQGNVG